MKIKKEDYNILVECIQRVIDIHGEEQLIQAFETGNFPRASIVKDLQTRFNWDLFYACQDKPDLHYLHDSHINTALKKICPKVTQRYTVNQLTGEINNFSEES